MKLHRQAVNPIGADTWKWKGSNDGSTWTDMTGAWGMGSLSTPLIVPITSNYGPWRYVKCECVGSGYTNNWWYEWEFSIGTTAGPAGRDEPVTIGSEAVSASATDRMTVRFADASDGNQDTKTTFYNRTGGPRDVIVEVTL